MGNGKIVLFRFLLFNLKRILILNEYVELVKMILFELSVVDLLLCGQLSGKFLLLF